MSIEHTEVVNAIIAGIGSNDNALDQMVQILANLKHAGYVIAPKEPTMKMIMAGHQYCRREPSQSMHSAEHCYLAMLDAFDAQ